MDIEMYSIVVKSIVVVMQVNGEGVHIPLCANAHSQVEPAAESGK
jgi:hypothetical protein